MRRVVIAGGGTGGHLYPGLALAERLRARGAEVVFFGTRHGVGGRVVPRHGFSLVFVRARGLSRSPLAALAALVETFVGLGESLLWMLRRRPDLVVGTGGYVSAPAIVAAALLGIPCMVLEQNAIPGKTTRFLAGWANRLCLSFPGSEAGLPPGKTEVTGNPIRPEIVTQDRAEARRRLDLPANGPCVLVTWASQGARSLNRAVLAALPRWAAQRWSLVHLTGPSHFEEVRAQAAPLVDGANLVYRCLGYTERMADLYAAADLVVARAGATTLAEISARGLPALLVPYPYAAEAHQDRNAEALARAGAARVLPDAEVEGRLAEEVTRLVADRAGRAEMARASQAFGRPSALDRIEEIARELASGPRARDGSRR